MVQVLPLVFLISSDRYDEPAPASPLPSDSVTSAALHNPLPAGGACVVDGLSDSDGGDVAELAGDVSETLSVVGGGLLAAGWVPLPHADSSSAPDAPTAAITT
ncbi:hypothetical protein GCM10022222_19970 [Amycolatopsis ultiminotia]|uniref:Secreted protein n=1 Tax=Amycolatopsis ultiminotia TaxID=543629 RepID=A0ABP6VM26_9PSEU